MQPTESSWTVDYALGELIAAIQAGALPLAIEPAVQQGYKDRFRRDFQLQHDQKIDWYNVSEYILKLARAVGNLATALTIAKAIRDHTSIPAAIDAENAYLAGYLVVLMRADCRPGNWCAHYYLRNPYEGSLPDVEGGAEVLGYFLKNITPESSPPPSGQ